MLSFKNVEAVVVLSLSPDGHEDDRREDKSHLANQ